MKVNILTKGFLSPTTRGWLHPVVKNRSKLLDMGIDISFFQKKNDSINECDVVIVESKFVRDDWSKDKSKIFDFLSNLKNNNKVIFYDLGDSTYSWVLEVLPYVDKLLKPFIFKDKNNYCIPLEGCNIISNYYFNNGLIEKDNSRKPKYLKEKDKIFLDKIQVGFNSTFADHSRDSNLWKYDYISRLTRSSFTLFSKFLKSNKKSDFTIPEYKRSRDLSCRMSLEGYSNGIKFHRVETSKILANYLSTNKLNRDKYFDEICNSKVVISPFGWGEINVPRDYEAALAGSVLLKPEISHIETWPNIFNKQTVVQYNWDLSNLLDIVDDIIVNYHKYIEFAFNLQDQFRDFSLGVNGEEIFCNYFINLLKN